ncbi:MAG: PVC-type heme-binding CxxCH protein [Pirellulales bacterium]
MLSARLAAVLFAVAAACACAAGAQQPGATLATLQVPEGFTVELAAAAPLVAHPIMAGFDDRGRLYVADNAGLNLPAEDLLKELPNMIRMLEDTDGDGRFDRATTFADKMTFPQGAAWFRGALYVASPPSIWRLEDTDGDGLADRRQELVQKFGFTGNAADIHGCFVTPTGRIAWCDGRHGHEFKNEKGEITSEGLAARVFTCRPDGGDLEVFCGGGMDNPVELAFTSDGDTLGTMTFYNPDKDRHDALVHFVYGGVYPKKHPCTSEFKRTGELMPAVSRFGVTAPSGLARYVGTAWGEEFRDNLFSTQFNTHKIVRHVLARHGATFTSTDEDFLVSTSGDFHPTDVVVDADGSLLVIDTGGWFRIGCPTSEIAKPEIGGAIYRIRRNNAAKIDDPRGLAIDWARTSDTEMADLLADPRPAVVERAIERLVPRGDAAMGTLATALFEPTDYRARQNAMWALARIGSQNALLLLRQGLSDDDAPGRLAAVKGLSDLRDADSILPLIAIVEKDEPAVRREAATALGRLRRALAVPALLQALEKPVDRFEEHALIFALIEINQREATLAGLQHENPKVRRAALIALAQMDSGNLTRELVAPLLATDDAALLRSIIEILGKHPEWGDELTGTLGTWLELKTPSAEQLAMTRGAVEALLGRPTVERLVLGALTDDATCKPTRLALLESVAAHELAPVVRIFADAVRPNLASSDDDVLRQAVVTATAVGAGPLVEPLLKTGLDQARPNDLRVAALCAASKTGGSLSREGFDFLAAQLTEPAALRDRLAAAEALGGFNLSAEQLRAATRLVLEASPLEMSWLLHAFEGSANAETGLALVASLAESRALASISPERLRETLKSFPPDVQSAAAKLVERAAPNDKERAAKLEALVSAVPDGDRARGEEVFFSQRSACSACHRVADRGERIGPELSKIGEIRTRRDLVEAVLFPSASLARGYESFSVATTGGQVYSGLVSRETASAVYLRTTERAEIRVDREDIDEFAPNSTSIMPQGLDKSLSPAEVRDLVAYLESLK